MKVSIFIWHILGKKQNLFTFRDTIDFVVFWSYSAARGSRHSTAAQGSPRISIFLIFSDSLPSWEPFLLSVPFSYIKHKIFTMSSHALTNCSWTYMHLEQYVGSVFLDQQYDSDTNTQEVETKIRNFRQFIYLAPNLTANSDVSGSGVSRYPCFT
jgi:hypothetical protein